MTLRIRSMLVTGALGFLIAFMNPSVAQDQDMTVASLATDLALLEEPVSCSATAPNIQDAQAVMAARAAGLSDLQIADAFGRASTTSNDPEALNICYAAFLAGSSTDSTVLADAYTAGEQAAIATGGRGNGRGPNSHANERAFNPPSGGTGGGDGSENK